MKSSPAWAEKWVRGTCGCGARLVHVECYCGVGHVACAASGYNIESCPKAKP